MTDRACDTKTRYCSDVEPAARCDHCPIRKIQLLMAPIEVIPVANTVIGATYPSEKLIDGVPGNFHLNNHRSVAVSNEVYWNEDMTTCPTGVKVQLLGQGGVAAYAHYQYSDRFWVGWAPLPKRRPK